MEGDSVAVLLEQPSAWPRLKGGNNKLMSNEPRGLGEVVQKHSEAEKEIVQLSSRLGDNVPSSDGMQEQHALGFSSTDQAESTVRDLGANASVPQLQQSSKDVHHLNYIQKDPGSGSVLALKQTENNVGVRCSNNADTNGKVATALANVVSLVMSLPGKRPAGKVVAILEKSFRWETVVGFLELPARAGNKCGPGRSHAFNVDDSPRKRRNLMLVPVDNRCPKMMVSRLPDDIHQRLWDGDSTVSNELLAAQVVGWQADSHFPVAVVKQSLGQGGELEAQQRAILLEHAISSGKFSPASLACLPELPWKIPVSEMKRRKNLFHLRVFSVVRTTAQDCAHALSIESLPDGAVRVGMHVADVSYFVQPGTALDQEAQMRSTSVSCVQEVLPMLPHVLCKDLCSLNPAVDRLAFSVMWDMNDVGDITNEWIGRTVVHSCAKLTHGHVQTMMDEVFPDFEGIEPREDMLGFETELPQIYGGHTWMDLVMDVCALHRIATKRRASRFAGGALELDQSKLVFALEEDGTPYESTMYNAKDSNLVVKEFMLLANTTVAHVISNAFPDSALLCCCPKPSPRKLKEFEDFCCKIGIDLDASSAGALSISLRNMRESVKHDPVLYSILMQYAAKPMQSTKYFCSREFKEKEKWAHCRHAIPLYTHFTSPMQRYPDIIVHRTLAAALEAEEALGNMAVFMPLTNSNQTRGILAAEKSKLGVPTETSSERGANSMPVSQWVLTSVTMKHQLRGSSELISLAAWCNQRRMESRTVKEASIKLNIWTMLKKNKQVCLFLL
jgi:DIS3-like exonuclease 2